VKLLSSSRAIRLIVDEITLPIPSPSSVGTKDKQVTGVVYLNSQSEEIQVATKTVIMCSGGYMACRSGSSLLAEFTADLCSLGTATGKHADGEGIKMTRAAGGELVHMTNVQFDAFGIINQVSTHLLCRSHLPVGPFESLEGYLAFVNSICWSYCRECGWQEDLQ
jgi:hypothetical protein